MEPRATEPQPYPKQARDTVQAPRGQAVKNMMAAALAEPRNQRFLLLSESCAPLYPPAVVHQQARALCARRVPRGCAS